VIQKEGPRSSRTQRWIHGKTAVLIGCALAVLLSPTARPQPVPETPQRIILNLTGSPATSMAVTWRMAMECRNAAVEYAAATPGTGFARATRKQQATMSVLNVPKEPIGYHYSAVMRDLKPGTTYVYRVGTDRLWSEWNQFTTAKGGSAPFSFVWFGDPQDEITEYVSRLFRQAVRTAPQAQFWLFSGDLTSEPEDDQWGELFEAQGFVPRIIPSVMVPGNHDLGFRFQGDSLVRNDKGKKVRDRSVSPLWRAHVTLPENGVAGLEETSYTFDYQGVRFVMMNSNDRLEDQARWVDTLLGANPNRWTVVSLHHPLYSSGRERDDRKTREAFLPLFDKHHVDLVLTGHDHTYARSFRLVNGTVVPEGLPGTVYIVSSSGPKFYEYTSPYDSLMAKSGVNIQLYQSITVDGGRLNFRAYTADGALYDSFELRK
jgi:acid phosphatase type 7